MKKLYFLSFLLLTMTFSYGQMISEFQPNPAGADPDPVSFEIKGTAGESFSGWVLSIESDGGNSQGTVDRATEVSGTFDSNGLLVVSIPDLENPSFTVVLTDNFTGAVGTTDIDTDNDGTPETVSELGNIFDAIGIPDNTGDEASIYGADLGGADFKYTGDEPKLVFRDANTNDWYAVNDDDDSFIFNINAEEVTGNFPANPDPKEPTFGALNPVFDATLSNELFAKNTFTIYPNPVTGNTVNIATKTGDAIAVKVYNVLGKQVLNTTVNSTLDISGLNSGMYILQLSQNGNTATKKLVIK